MKKIFILFLLLFSSCIKPKTVLICGDHICVNKAEAEHYFEENLILEVQVIDKKKSKEINLVELNLETLNGNEKRVSILNKKQTNEVLKELSKEEIKIRKKEVKKSKKLKTLESPKRIRLKSSKTKDKNNIVLNKKKEINNNNKDVNDICSILRECDIDEISKYLVREGKKREFPDITLRENK